MTFPWRPTSAREVAKHAARIVSVIARACFWLVCFHYFGSESFLFVAASWMFTLAVKDLTFARIRLISLDDPAKRPQAMVQSLAVELMLLVIRGGLMVLVATAVAPFSATVAALISGLLLIPIFWSRETARTLMRAYRVGALGVYISMLSALAGIITIVAFAETGKSAVDAAVAALMMREITAFVLYFAGAIAGRLGLRLRGGDEFDDDDGATQYSVTGTGGREVRAAWKVLIADNVVWARWRMVQFATRYIVGGVLGPFGTIGTRLFFTYKQPGAYVHKEQRLDAATILRFAIAATILVSVLAVIAQRFGLLHALGITIVGFVFRLAALCVNFLLWRQLTPMVAVGRKVRLPGRRSR